MPKADDRTPDQYAGLCWRVRSGELEFLLATSRRTGRWIFPKGNAEPDEAPGDAAAREAQEEVGVIGRPGKAAIGRYGALKVTEEQCFDLLVELWPVEITEILRDYPEAGLRHRRMATVDQALALIEQADMRNLLKAFAGTIGDRKDA